MRHFLPCLVFVALSAAAACARTPPAPSSSGDTGVVVSPATSFDFGTATEGDTLKHTFVLTNAGSTSIVFDRVQPASSALQVIVTPMQLGPGAKANLDVTFDTLDRPGDHDKLITVASSDKGLPPVSLRVRARVQPLLEVEQEQEEDEEDEEVRMGETKAREFKILGKKANEAQLSIERVTSPDVTAEVVNKPQDGGISHEIKVTIQGKKLGHYHAVVFVRTGLANKPVLKHFFDWNVVGNIQIVPRSLHFETGAAAQPQERVAEFKSRLDGFAITGAKSDSPAFKPTFRRATSGKSWELHVAVVDKAVLATTQTARIDVTTNDPIEPSIPLNLTVSAPAAAPASAKPSR